MNPVTRLYLKHFKFVKPLFKKVDFNYKIHFFRNKFIVFDDCLHYLIIENILIRNMLAMPSQRLPIDRKAG